MTALKEPTNRGRRDRGSALIEFLLCVGLFWIPLFLGLCQFGLKLIQAVTVTQVCRDSGHLYAYGIDFSQTSNQYLLASFAPSLKIDPTGAGGTSVVILSTVNYIDSVECQSGGYPSTCPNFGQIVFTNQVIVGNPNLHASAYGTPTTNSSGVVSLGSPTTSGYLNQSSALVKNFPNITLSAGSTGQQYAYICEMYSQSTSMNLFLPGNGWVSSASFF